jgi:hypothetical protein
MLPRTTGEFVRGLLDALIETSPPLTQSDVAEVQRLRSSDNPALILDFLKHISGRQTPSYSRVCQQLHGHVDFLMHLAATPELLSLFLISEKRGSTLVPATVQKLIREQAHRTTEFLANVSDTEFAKIIPTINDQLNCQFDAQERSSDLRRFIEHELTDPKELTELLYQELVICDALQRLLTKLSVPPHRELRPDELEQLKSRIRTETAEELRPLLREEIRAELAASVREEVIRDLTRKLKVALRRELETELRQKLAAQIESDLKAGIEEATKARLTKSIRQQLREELAPVIEEEQKAKLTVQFEKQLEIERAELRPELAKLFPSVCTANGTAMPAFSNDAFLNECQQLAADVIELRSSLGIESGRFLRAFSDVQFENAHLDQLHTQTRSLLVRQAQMISELREQAQNSSWTAWAKKVYRRLTHGDFASDDIARLRRAIEKAIPQR